MSKVVFCTLACFAVSVKTKTCPRSGMFTTSQYRSVLMFHIVHIHKDIFIVRVTDGAGPDGAGPLGAADVWPATVWPGTAAPDVCRPRRARRWPQLGQTDVTAFMPL